MKRYNVYWTKEATIDLYEILEYISYDDVIVAKKIYRNIKIKCSKLKNNPEKYRIIPELADMGIYNYREIIYSPYRIVFKITKPDIYVFAVIDSRRDFESIIFNRLVRE